MIDLGQLPPAEMAAQLARPTGDIGVAVGDYMTNLNSRQIATAYALLSPPANGRLLEVGFGNGKLIASLLAMAPGLTYLGVDVSATMVHEASRANRALADAGRVNLYLAAVDRLPFSNAAFDRVVAVNSIYFWPDPLAGLREIRRVLRSDGFLVLASMTPETSARSPAARPEFGFNIFDEKSLTNLHREAGFTRVACDIFEEEAKRLDGSTFRRACHMVLAHPG
jgi:ubiquinone/menaquinone biosynthesis C-methylase UbiE